MTASTWRRTGVAVGLAFMALWCLFPMYWMLASSLKGQTALLSNSLVPAHATLDNFKSVFDAQNNFGYALRNSVVIATTTTVLALALGTLTAYALARLRFRFRGLVLGAILTASMFPGIAILTPLFKLFSDWGWIDQYQALVLPDISFAPPLGVWVLTNFLRQLPWELEEAALVDGATRTQAFVRIMLPLVAPGLFTTAILVYIQTWNEFLIASAMSVTLASKPVTVAIAQFSGGSQYEVPFGNIMAAGVIVTFPLIVLVLVFQRRIVSGLSAGAIKG